MNHRSLKFFLLGCLMMVAASSQAFVRPNRLTPGNSWVNNLRERSINQRGPIFNRRLFSASFLTCTPELARESTGTAWCDVVPGRYQEDVLCLVEPLENIVQQVTRGNVCLLGKFKDRETMERLVDLVVLAGNTGDDLSPLLANDAPDIQTLPDTGEFLMTIPVTGTGQRTLEVRAKVLNPNPTSGSPYINVSMVRQVVPVSRPDFEIPQARFCTEIECASPTSYFNPSNTMTNGSSTDPTRRVDLQPSSAMDESVSARAAELCLKPSDGNVTVGDHVTITVTNQVCDPECTASQKREITLNGSCIDSTGDGFCDPSSACGGGYSVRVPVAHGQNNIEIFANNVLPDRDWLVVEPFQVDLKGPEMTVRYFDEAGEEVHHVDGNVILASEAREVLVDIVLQNGREPSGMTMCNVDGPPACAANSPLCFRWQNPAPETRENGFLQMCPQTINGETHYRVKLENMRFPINTITFQGQDDFGNQTRKTHAFGYGEVRPLMNDQGQFKLADAMIPESIAGFIPKSFVEDGNTGLRKVVVEALNSDEFEKNIFLKLLEPHPPQPEEEGRCSYVDEKTVRMFRFFGHSIDKIEVPSLHLLNNNTVWMQLKIKGLRGPAEIFALRLQDSDRDGERDTEETDADNDGKPNSEDTDDDNDGHLDTVDMVPGKVVPDPLLGIGVLPVNFAVRELTLNMQIRLTKRDGRISFQVSNVPQRKLVEAFPDNKQLLELNCGKASSQLMVDGSSLDIDQQACEGLRALNEQISSQGLDPTCENQNLNQTFVRTLETLISINTPQRIKNLMEEYEENKLTALSLTLFGQKINFDFFSPLLSSDLEINASGIFFKGKSLLVTGGVTDEGTSREAPEFLESIPDILGLSNDFPFEKFGPLYEEEGGGVDPLEAAFRIGRESNLALKEETINSAMHAANLLLWDLTRMREMNGQERPKLTLDLSAQKVREAGLSIPEPNDTTATCVDETGDPTIDLYGNPKDKSDDWKCLFFAFNLDRIFGAHLDYAGLEDGRETPMIVRNRFDPFSPITVRLVDIHPMGGGLINAEFELGIRNMAVSIFEEAINPSNSFPRGTGFVRNWCSRYPGMSPTDCSEGKEVPIASFRGAGSLFVNLVVDVGNEGLVYVQGGLSSIRRGQTRRLDETKSYLEIETIENNTIVPDKILAEQFRGSLFIFLDKYIAAAQREIRMAIPTTIPFIDFCTSYFPASCDNNPGSECLEEVASFCRKVRVCDQNACGEGCDSLNLLQDVLDKVKKYNVQGLTLNNLSLGLDHSPLGSSRYLTTGTDMDFQLGPPSTIGTSQQCLSSDSAFPRPGNILRNPPRAGVDSRSIREIRRTEPSHQIRRR